MATEKKSAERYAILANRSYGLYAGSIINVFECSLEARASLEVAVQQ